MKIRYFKGISELKKKRSIAKAKRRQEYKEDIAKWHRKFAWLPMDIETPEDTKNHSTAVWGEYVFQKGWVKSQAHMPELDETIWTRHTEKEYFIKKLDGTLAPEAQFSHDGEDQNMAFAGTTSFGAVSIKAG